MFRIIRFLPVLTEMNFNDFETLVMRRLRQEEERKKIIEEMKRQDAEEEN